MDQVSRALLAAGGGSAAEQVYIEDVFSTFLYAGNGSTQTINNGVDLAGKGGLVWAKSRSNATQHILADTAQGAGKYLSSNSSAAATTNSLGITSFTSSGFGMSSGDGQINANTFSYVSWTFRKQPKFFDVVTFTRASSGSPFWVSHSLGAMPGFVIIKALGATEDWFLVHRAANGIGYLNGTNQFNSTSSPGLAPPGTFAWMNATSTQFDVANFAQIGVPYVAYLFAHNAGGFGVNGTDNVISCGSFTTDASGNATIELGWEPQFLITKRTSSAGNWRMLDVMRGWSRSSQGVLYPNTANEEGGSTQTTDFPYATGFSVKEQISVDSYIYIAIRRGPMRAPTTGTSILALANNVTGGTGVVNAGFPVDLTISTQANSISSDRAFNDRLRGFNVTGRSLSSSSANLEAALVNTIFGASPATTNTQFAIQGYGANDAMVYGFRRAPGFLDVVCYTGTGSNLTLNHNLGVAPELVVIKKRNGIDPWPVKYHTISGLLYLNTNSQLSAANDPVTALTATTITLLNTVGSINQAGSTYVAYLFASVAGVSKVGIYTGNGSSQTIGCGFTNGSRFVLIKRTDSNGDWTLFDSARGIVAANDPALYLNSNVAQVTTADAVDSDNAGFIVNQESTLNLNVTSATYIYLAIA